MSSTVYASAADTLCITSLSSSEVQEGVLVLEVVSPNATESPLLPLSEGHHSPRPMGPTAGHLCPS